jgi:hypothetical protein
MVALYALGVLSRIYGTVRLASALQKHFEASIGRNGMEVSRWAFGTNLDAGRLRQTLSNVSDIWVSSLHQWKVQMFL